jgi:hypothetical protein
VPKFPICGKQDAILRYICALLKLKACPSSGDFPRKAMRTGLDIELVCRREKEQRARPLLSHKKSPR